MIKGFIFSISFFSIFSIACQNSTEPSDINFLGTWVDSYYEEGGIRVLTKWDSLINDKGGYTFYSDHTLKDRKNIGFCGTPPVVYANYDGIWQLLSEDRIRIVSNYWGGIDTVEVDIIYLDDSELKLRYYY